MIMDYNYTREIESKQLNDRPKSSPPRRVWVAGPVIVGAGPSGLAAAACLKQRGVPSLILERAHCIASLWKVKTYDRLKLHLPKHFCQLPLMPFPPDFPTYPTKQQFLQYLTSYADHFDLNPVFNRSVVNARFDHRSCLWSVRTVTVNHEGVEKQDEEVIEYLSQWLVVATGENAEQVVPEIEGMGDFGGEIVHTCEYKSGEVFRGKRVLVVGCGNSGMEVCLDLFNYDARPSLVVRDSVHVLPQEMFGRSTFGLSMFLSKWFPLWLVDWFLLLVSRFILGDTSKYGLTRPEIGPLQLKFISGKTPVLDIGTFSKIRNGDIKVCKGIKRLSHHAVEFVDGKIENFDAIILATGYKSNVMTWLNLKHTKTTCEKEGLRKLGSEDEERQGLYTVGFTQRGLLGASADAKRISQEIEQSWKADSTTHNYCNPMPLSTIISSPSSSSPTTRPPTL